MAASRNAAQTTALAALSVNMASSSSPSVPKTIPGMMKLRADMSAAMQRIRIGGQRDQRVSVVLQNRISRQRDGRTLRFATTGGCFRMLA